MAEQITLDPVEVAEGAIFAPSVRAVGTAAAGTGNITPGLPAGTAEGDILNLFVQTDTENIAAPAGYAHVTGSPVTQSTNTKLHWLWKRAAAGETAPTITDPGDHAIARIVGVQGAAGAGYPFETSDTATEATSDTSASIPGNAAPLRGPNRLVLAAIATGADVLSTAQASSWANASAAAVTERVDDWTDASNGGGIGVASFAHNERFYPATTATLGTAAPKALMSAAILPAIREQLELNTAPLRVLAEGVDWGDAQIQAYLADQHFGSAQVDFRVPNRELSLPLAVTASSQTEVRQAQQRLAAKVAQIQQQGGGWLKRQRGDGSKVYLDVLNASLKTADVHSHLGWETDMVLKLEAIPEFYGDETALSDHAETTAAELCFTETVEGDYPARCRIVVDNDDATNHQRGLLWGVRSRYYDSASTAALAYEAEALEPLSPAASAALSGASGGNAVQHTGVTGVWTRMVGFRLSGTTPLTHVGTYRLWARVRTTASGPTKLRMVWAVGGLSVPTENNEWTFPRPDDFYLADLGELNLQQLPVGPQRWYGQIQAQGAAGVTSTVQIDRVWLQPVDDGCGRVAAPDIPPVEGTADYLGPNSPATTANDAAAGTVAWTSITNAMTSDNSYASADLAGPAFSQYLKVTNFSFAIPSGATINGIQVEIEKSRLGGIHTISDAWDAPKLVKAGAITGSARPAPSTWPVSDQYFVYGGPTDLWASTWTQAEINAIGFGAAIRVQPEGSSPGVARVDHVRITVYYTASGGWIPPTDVCVAATRSAELCTDGIVRQEPDGSGWKQMASVVGSMPRLPVSGAERRPVEVLLKPSRGDMESLADSGIDDVSARVFYRPCWLQVPA